MYCTVQELQEIGSGINPDGVPNAPDDMLRRVIARASRIMDLKITVKPGYFESAYYPVWASGRIYLVGDIVTPITRNNHRYIVTTAGTSGATEPVWPTGAAGTVTSGNVVFTESGADVAVSARTFYGDGTTKLRIDPYIAGTLNTTITVPDGYTAPEFIEKEGFLVRTVNGVIVDPTYGGYYGLFGACGWIKGLPVTATALWGWNGTPEDIKLATIELAVNLYREVDPANMKLTGMDGASLREALPPRVKGVIAEYKFSEAKAVFV
jgi:hypothetical protein